MLNGFFPPVDGVGAKGLTTGAELRVPWARDENIWFDDATNVACTYVVGLHIEGGSRAPGRGC